MTDNTSILLEGSKKIPHKNSKDFKSGLRDNGNTIHNKHNKLLRNSVSDIKIPSLTVGKRLSANETIIKSRESYQPTLASSSLKPS
jgi:hypothetical protein